MITYNNLCLKFHYQTIFENLSGTINAGEFLGIMGPNGSGKSSFLKCIGGLLAPTGGSILLHQLPLISYSEKSLSKIRAYGRSDMQCAWDLTVDDILRLSENYSKDTVETRLASLKAAHLQKKNFATLSGGERSLVILALTLLQDTPLILLDEITAMLDDAYADHVMSLLQNEAGRGKAVITILHDKGLAKKYCQRLLLF
jgi:iron complex transport system ATP-binding protein